MVVATSIKLTTRLLRAGVKAGVRIVGDSYDNALAENMWSCPAPSLWHKISGLLLVDRVWRGIAKDLGRPVEAQDFVRPDAVEDAAGCLGFAVVVFDGDDLASWTR